MGGKQGSCITHGFEPFYETEKLCNRSGQPFHTRQGQGQGQCLFEANVDLSSR